MPKGDNDTRPDANLIEGVGASDASNGGGAGRGVPDADTAMRSGDTTGRGDTREDREKLFPSNPGDPRSMSKQRATTGGDAARQDEQRRGSTPPRADVSDEETE